MSSHRYGLWHPGQWHGHREMLMASVTSSGISWNTIPVLTYLSMLVVVCVGVCWLVCVVEEALLPVLGCRASLPAFVCLFCPLCFGVESACCFFLSWL